MWLISRPTQRRKGVKAGREKGGKESKSKGSERGEKEGDGGIRLTFTFPLRSLVAVVVVVL